MKLRLEGIKKTIENQEILHQVNLSAKEGEFLTVFGESGSGKSTILKVITGLLEVEEGKVYLDEIEITGLPTEKRGISYVFQEPHLFPHLTVRGNISFGMEIHKYTKSDIQKRVDYLMNLMQIGDLGNRYPHQLSGGQKQRVSIARALAPEPSLLLMDEPFSGLDLGLREDMGALIKSIQEKIGLTIIFVTHDINECLRLSDSIALLKEGRILQQGSTREVYYQPRSREAATLMGKGNWIAGKILQERFLCDLFQRDAEGHPDGLAEAFIRPHQIRLLPGNRSSLFTVESIRYIGKESEVVVRGNGKAFTVETFDVSEIEIGKKVGVEFSDFYGITGFSKEV